LYAEGEAFAGYGTKPKAFFWIGHRNVSQTSVHVAFTAQDRATVDRFHKAALEAGGGALQCRNRKRWLPEAITIGYM
jgi:hypothetical protein